MKSSTKHGNRKRAHVLAASLALTTAAGARTAAATDLTEAAAPRVVIGADPVFLAPVGGFRDQAGLGLGGLLAAELALGPSLRATARAGYIQFLEKDRSALVLRSQQRITQIPLLAGLSWRLAPHLSLGGELALSLVRTHNVVTSSGQDPVTYRTSQLQAGATVGLGYDVGGFVFGARASFLSFENPISSVAALLSVGYRLPVL
jgi:hypothetical protein